MLFNSIDFALFFPIVFFIYWFVVKGNLKLQNCFLVLASCFFYAWWDWRFLSLIFISTSIDFLVGLGFINQPNERKRKWLLSISIITNLGILGFFKYYNFFIGSFTEAFSLFGMSLQAKTLNIILPVGISFYTFQTLSYTIDLYRKKISATKDFIAFMAFVSFFPQLMAGPIERAGNFLSQFFVKREFSYVDAADGLKQILWGLFKKIVIADQCGVFVDKLFADPSGFSGITLLIGACFFAFQIYGDFSGYSDMAIGFAKLLGFKLSKNFAFPFFSRSMTEFWRRWHISLCTWFRDYIYIPLGGSKRGKIITVRNTFIVFLISGLWHGADWSFIVWGGLNACCMLPAILLNTRKNYDIVVANNSIFPSVKEFTSIFFIFILSSILFVFFRSTSVAEAHVYLIGIFSKNLFIVPRIADLIGILFAVILLLFFIFVEWSGRRNAYAIATIGEKRGKIFRWSFYSFIIFLIGMYMRVGGSEFIYFQF